MRVPTKQIAGLVSIVGLVLAWEISARMFAHINPLATSIYPSLSHVLTVSLPSFSLMARHGTPASGEYQMAFHVLAENSYATLLRLIAGTVFGIVLGVLTGLFIGASTRIRDLLWPTIQLLRQVPSLALVPLFLLWFGGAEIGTVSYIGWAIFIMMVVYTIEAVRNVSPLPRQFARTLGASPAQVYRTVLLPAIIPMLIGGVRVCLGVSWAIVLAAELLGSQLGLGRLLYLSQAYFDTGRMIVIVALFIVYGFVTNALVVWAGYSLTKWVPQQAA